VSNWLSKFESALASGDPDSVSDLFAEESFWRDIVAFTWTIQTLEGAKSIGETAIGSGVKAMQFSVDGPASDDGFGGTQAWVKFETDVALGQVNYMCIILLMRASMFV
jgi:putative flavoprotein involved in K+ transport